MKAAALLYGVDEAGLIGKVSIVAPYELLTPQQVRSSLRGAHQSVVWNSVPIFNFLQKII